MCCLLVVYGLQPQRTVLHSVLWWTISVILADKRLLSLCIPAGKSAIGSSIPWHQPFNLFQTTLFNPETCISILKRHPFTGNLNRETSGDSKHAFLHCGDVSVLW